MDKLTKDNNAKISSDNDEARQAYVKGTKLMIENRFEEAEPYLSQAVKLDPSFMEALDHLGIVYRRLKKYEEAEKVYLRSVELNDRNSSAYINLALVYRDLDRPSDAFNMFKKAHKIDGDDPEPYFGMGALCQSLEDYEQSKTYLSYAIDLYRKSKSERVYDAFYNQGINHYALKEYDEALECFSHVIKVYPDDENTLKFIAEIKELLANSMTKEEFNDFINSCYKECENKQKALIKDFNLPSYDSYWFSQTTEILQFKNDGKVELEFTVVPIGSWSGESNSWMWAWANESITEELRLKAAKIRELSDLTGNDIFKDDAFEADEALAHKLTAMAVHHLDALGMYIAPLDNLKTFFALIKVK
jgi:tetratricopeptide (TPR) repeat protein